MAAEKEKKTAKMKSAYELALERMEGQGIQRPNAEALSDATRTEMADVRRQAEAKLAELEILHRDRLGKTAEPEERAKDEEQYARERARIERQREAKLAKLRGE